MQGWGVYEKECLKIASDAGGNGTAGLVITWVMVRAGSKRIRSMGSERPCGIDYNGTQSRINRFLGGRCV